MNENTVQLPKAFPPVDTTVTRIIRGVSGTPFEARRLDDTIAVTWGRTTMSRTDVSINGIVVQEGLVFGDDGRLGSSVQSALESWREQVEAFGATAADRFEVSVVSWLEDLPTLGFSHDNVFGQKCYHMARSEISSLFLDFGSPLAPADAMPKTLDVVKHSKTVVTSSLWNNDRNAASVSDFLARADESERTVGQKEDDFH